jgi:hypothetical protein
MPANQTQRPKFYEEQYLGAADLTAAVDYGRIQQARHALGAHTWGIATGLDLKETPQPGGAVTVHLLPGYAWDGYGRPIVVLSPYKIPEELFSAIKFDKNQDKDGKGRLIAIWLRYDELATRPPKPGFESCEGGEQYARIQETFRIEIDDKPSPTDRYSGVTIASKSLTDAKTALQAFDPSAPLLYDEAVPHQTFPDLQTRVRWLVPIGYVRWLPVENSPGHFVARDDSGASGAEKDSDKIRRVRRYIGVVTEEIEEADRAIRLRDRGKDPAASFYSAPTLQQIKDSTNDLVWVEGHLRVVGNAKLCDGKLDFRDVQGDDANVPLTIRRTENAGPGARALQVSIGNGPTNKHRFGVGPLQGGAVDEKFSVVGNGNVGIGTTDPQLKLEIRGEHFGRDDDKATLHLWGSRIGDVGNEILFVRAFDGGVVAFDGNNNRVGVGTKAPVAKLEVAGDLALQKMAPGATRALAAGATMCWNDGTWLRLNQNLDYSKPIFGVHTPGLFAPVSLNVGGIGGYADPGGGNVAVAGRVGIGTVTPQAALQVTSGAIMPAVGNGQNAGIQFPSDPGGGAFDQAFIRYFAISGETTKLLIGIANDADDAIGFEQFGGERMTIRDGNVGIGVLIPSNKLDVAGDLRITGVARRPGGGSWTDSSDVKLKKEVAPLTGVLDKLLQLRGVSFEWKEPARMGNLFGTQTGLVAQEVEPIFPDWVSTGPDGHKEITIRGFEALTIEALRELKVEIDKLKAAHEQPAQPAPRAKAATLRKRSRKKEAES